MATSVSAIMTAQFDVTAVLTDPGIGGTSQNAVVYNAFDTIKLALNAASSPAITKFAVENVVLATNAKTIDLTALTGVNGAAVDATGTKLYGYLFQAPIGNGAGIKIAVGASNGYNWDGASSSVTLNPGETRMAIKTGNSSVVGSGAKTIDLTGTGSTDNLNVLLVFGP